MNDCGHRRSGMTRPRLGLTVAGLLFVVAAVSVAQFKPANPPPGASPVQQPGIPPQSTQPPLFSVKVNLVRLLVSVRDSMGAIITNLDRQDFRVLDSGVEQKIAVFERNTSLAALGCIDDRHKRQHAGRLAL